MSNFCMSKYLANMWLLVLVCSGAVSGQTIDQKAINHRKKIYNVQTARPHSLKQLAIDTSALTVNYSTIHPIYKRSIRKKELTKH
jgi:hypothetical protein